MEFKCQFCGKELNTQGGKNLHEYRCSMRPDGQGNKEGKNQKKGCNHKYRVLKPHELKTLQDNGVHDYVEVCQICDDLN